jgi:hypothetical protein
MGKISSIASILFCVLAFTVADAQTSAVTIYQSGDGKESITLVSADKAERLTNGRTMVGTYLRKKGSLQITYSVQGVSFTTAYRVTEGGLVSKDGKVLLKK